MADPSILDRFGSSFSVRVETKNCSQPPGSTTPKYEICYLLIAWLIALELRFLSLSLMMNPARPAIGFVSCVNTKYVPTPAVSIDHGYSIRLSFTRRCALIIMCKSFLVGIRSIMTCSDVYKCLEEI